jgi:hypothetical protein
LIENKAERRSFSRPMFSSTHCFDVLILTKHRLIADSEAKIIPASGRFQRGGHEPPWTHPLHIEALPRRDAMSPTRSAARL